MGLVSILDDAGGPLKRKLTEYPRIRLPPRRPSLPRPAADEVRALDKPRRHFTKVSSLPLLGLEYFHEYLDRYSAKKIMRRGFRGCARSVLAANSLQPTQTPFEVDFDCFQDTSRLSIGQPHCAVREFYGRQDHESLQGSGKGCEERMGGTKGFLVCLSGLGLLVFCLSSSREKSPPQPPAETDSAETADAQGQESQVPRKLGEKSQF